MKATVDDVGLGIQKIFAARNSGHLVEKKRSFSSSLIDFWFAN
jgi:hypothetical protein